MRILISNDKVGRINYQAITLPATIIASNNINIENGTRDCVVGERM